MIALYITPTGKSYSPRDEWHHLAMAPEVKHFDDMKAARDYLRERYGRAKRSPMYQDRKNGPPVVIGYVIGFRASDCSHHPIEHWLQQDWVEFREEHTMNLHGKA